MSNKQMEMMAREHDMSGIDEKFADEAAQVVADAAVSGYKKIEQSVVGGYKKIETGVVEGYKKIETGAVEGFGKVVDKCAGIMLNEDGSLKTGKLGEAVVNGYKKIENAFVNTFIAKEEETPEDAKSRITADQKDRIDTILEAGSNAGKRS